LINLICSIPFDFNSIAVEAFCASEIKYKYNQLLYSEVHKQEKLEEFKEKCEVASKLLVETVCGPSMRSYQKFSCYFSIRKLANHVAIHRQSNKILDEN